MFIFRFSVIRNDNGSISTVYYPPNESSTVVAFKKKLAQLISVDVSSSINWWEDDDNVVLAQETLAIGQAVNMTICQTTTINKINGIINNVLINEHISSDNEDTGNHSVLLISML